MLAVMWVVELLNALAGYQFLVYGIVPRTTQGLIGVFASPFLHESLTHLLANTIPLAILGTLVVLRGRQSWAIVTAFVVLVGGSGVWLLGRSASHVGASGVVFGYFGYLAGGGWYDRSPLSVGIALLTIFLYGGIIWGILPSTPRVSWEGHLFGLAAGVLLARSSR